MRSRGAQKSPAGSASLPPPVCPWAHDGQRGRFSGRLSRLHPIRLGATWCRAWASDLTQCSHAESGTVGGKLVGIQNEGAVQPALDELVDPPDAEQRRQPELMLIERLR